MPIKIGALPLPTGAGGGASSAASACPPLPIITCPESITTRANADKQATARNCLIGSHSCDSINSCIHAAPTSAKALTTRSKLARQPSSSRYHWQDGARYLVESASRVSLCGSDQARGWHLCVVGRRLWVDAPCSTENPLTIPNLRSRPGCCSSPPQQRSSPSRSRWQLFTLSLVGRHTQGTFTKGGTFTFRSPAPRGQADRSREGSRLPRLRCFIGDLGQFRTGSITSLHSAIYRPPCYATKAT